MKDLYKNKKVLVLGLGLSGRSAVHFLLVHKANVYGADKNAALLLEDITIQELVSKGLNVLLENPPLDIKKFDFVVVSPGIPHTNSWYKAAQEAGIEIIGEIELACRFVCQKFIGITGTNGKTTVTLLVAHVLNACGKSARALGNVGVPLTSDILNSNPQDILVVELSSYQLETMESRVIDAGVVLNITPDHLDRYNEMNEYAKAKFNIQNCIKEDGLFFIEERAFNEFGNLFIIEKTKPQLYGYSPKCHLKTDCQKVFLNDQPVFNVPDQYRGKHGHDLENLLAAFALCHTMGVTADQFIQALETFKKPPHRVEFCRQLHGVNFYDDSKGTNIDAVMRAVASLSGYIILIAGGVDKGASYTPWIESFANRVKEIYAIGQAAPKIHDQLSHAIPVKICENLEKAVLAASQNAVSGDHILLSPGCSSFDMFRDYAHRGEEFKKIVNQLDKEILR